MAAPGTVSSRSMHQSGIIYFALKTMLKYSNCLSWAFRSKKALKCPLVGFVQKNGVRVRLNDFILQGYGKKSFKTDLETHKVTLSQTVFIIYVWWKSLCRNTNWIICT